MTKDKSYNLGIFYAFFSVSLWGTTFIGGRWLLKDNYIDPITLSILRFGIGGLLLLVFGYILCREKIFSIDFKNLIQLFLLSFCGITSMSTFLFVGQTYTSAINTSVIMAFSPVLVMILGTFMKEKLNRHIVVGTILSLTGCMMTIGIIKINDSSYNGANVLGDFMVFLSAISWAIYILLSQGIVKRLGGLTVTIWVMLGGTMQLIGLRCIWPWEFIVPSTSQWNQWLVIIYLAVFPTAIAFFTWHEAISRIKLSLLNLMQYLSPVSTVILAWVILGEKMDIFNVVGVLLTIAGVMIASKKLTINNNRNIKTSNYPAKT